MFYTNYWKVKTISCSVYVGAIYYIIYYTIYTVPYTVLTDWIFRKNIKTYIFNLKFTSNIFVLLSLLFNSILLNTCIMGHKVILFIYIYRYIIVDDSKYPIHF